MNRKLMSVGLSVLVAMAMSAFGASVAQAQFTSDKEHTISSGSQVTNHTFSAGEGFGGITCATATFSGTGVQKSEATITGTPVYANCKDSFGRVVHIDNSKLTGTFTSGADLGVGHLSGGMTLTITSGGSVVCTVTIESPQTLTGAEWTNLGGAKGVEVNLNITNLATTTSGGFFNCGIANGEHEDGTYTGSVLIQGKDTAGNPAAISVD
jgi:hypothetical protein